MFIFQIQTKNTVFVKIILFYVFLRNDLNYFFIVLIISSHSGHHQIVNLLFRNEANLYIQTQGGKTALIIDSLLGHHQTVNVLLNNIEEFDS